jgi:hypothetical protein
MRRCRTPASRPIVAGPRLQSAFGCKSLLWWPLLRRTEAIPRQRLRSLRSQSRPRGETLAFRLSRFTRLLPHVCWSDRWLQCSHHEPQCEGPGSALRRVQICQSHSSDRRLAGGPSRDSPRIAPALSAISERRLSQDRLRTAATRDIRPVKMATAEHDRAICSLELEIERLRAVGGRLRSRTAQDF